MQLKAETREKVGLPNREVIVFDFEKQSFSDLSDLTEKYFVYIGKGLYLTQIISEKEQLNLHKLRTCSWEQPINTGFSVVFTESGKYYLDNVFGGLCADLEMFDSSDDFGMFSVGWHKPRHIFRDLIDD